MNVEVTRDTLTPNLRQLIAEVKSPRAVLGAGAKSIQKGISAHLKVLQSRGNAKGWPAQKFFAGKATSVERQVGVASLTDAAAVITIADARFVHRIEGGLVSAKRGAMLAIPLTAEAYALAGKGSLRQSAPGLQVVKTTKGAFLARPDGNRMIFLFRLVHSVMQHPHPSELPDQAALSKQAEADMVKAANILIARAASKGP